jgi:hypothetical protein
VIHIDHLTDDEIQNCINDCGVTDVSLVKRILLMPDIVVDNVVDEELFADAFADAIEGFIVEEEFTEEWYECNSNNWDFGFDIASTINDYAQT